LPSGEFVPLLWRYFERFSDKACCFEDLKPYIAETFEDIEDGRVSGSPQWLSHLRQVSEENNLDHLKGLQRLINALKLIRYSNCASRTTDEEQIDAINFFNLYLQALPLGDTPWYFSL
jgi:N-terminal acetyltransferase B complex non-catalytic subunit